MGANERDGGCMGWALRGLAGRGTGGQIYWVERRGANPFFYRGWQGTLIVRPCKLLPVALCPNKIPTTPPRKMERLSLINKAPVGGYEGFAGGVVGGSRVNQEVA